MTEKVTQTAPKTRFRMDSHHSHKHRENYFGHAVGLSGFIEQALSSRRKEPPAGASGFRRLPAPGGDILAGSRFMRKFKGRRFNSWFLTMLFSWQVTARWRLMGLQVMATPPLTTQRSLQTTPSSTRIPSSSRRL